MSSENGTNDWDLHPELYQQDDTGSFVLKKDGTPRKKAGRAKGSKGRGYNYHSETKAKLAAKKAVRDKQKRVNAVEAKLQRQRKTLNSSKELLNKLDNKTVTTGQVVTDDVIDEAPLKVKEEVNKNVILRID